jgi:hypothetical protein
MTRSLAVRSIAAQPQRPFALTTIPPAAAHAPTFSLRIAAAINPGNASGVHANDGTPRAASLAANARSYAGAPSPLSASRVKNRTLFGQLHRTLERLRFDAAFVEVGDQRRLDVARFAISLRQ